MVNLRLLKRCERNKVERQKVASFLKNGVWHHFSQKSKVWTDVGSWDRHTWWRSKIKYNSMYCDSSFVTRSWKRIPSLTITISQQTICTIYETRVWFKKTRLAFSYHKILNIKWNVFIFFISPFLPPSFQNPKCLLIFKNIRY